MKLDSFRELLAKRAGDPELEQLVKFMRDEVLISLAVESLEKMADHKGSKAPSALTMFAGSMTNSDVDMLHDALGHHVSHYRAAKEAGNDKAANKHLERTVHLMDFAARSQKHSHGKMMFDHVPTHAWEMNATGADTRVDKHGKTKYVQDQKGLGRRLSEKSKKFQDYSYLEQEPHEAYKHKGRLGGHSGGYPFEDMSVNGKHIVVDHDVEHPGEYTSHEFDNHPIFDKHEGGKKSHWEQKESAFTDDHRQELANKFAEWEDSPHVEKWEDRHEAMEDADPEGYASRGKEKSKSALDNVNIGEPKIDPDHVPDHLKHLLEDNEPADTATVEDSGNEDSSEEIDPDHVPDHLKHLLKAKDPDEMSAEELIEYYKQQETGEGSEEEPEEGLKEKTSGSKDNRVKRSTYVDDLDPEELKNHKQFAHHWTAKAGQQRRMRADAKKNPVLFAEGHRDAAHNAAHEDYNAAYHDLISSDDYKDMSASKKRRAEREFKKDWLKENPDHYKNAASAVGEAHKMHEKASDVARKEKEQQTNYILQGAPQGGSDETMSVEEAIQHAGGSRNDKGESTISTGSSVEASFANTNRDFIQDYRNKIGSTGSFSEYIEELDNPDSKLHSHPVLDHPENKERESKMMKEYGGLIDKNINRMKSKLRAAGIPADSVDEGDLKVAGMHGLFSALRDFNPQSGSKFASHAGGRIQGQMQSHVGSLDPIPKELRSQLKVYEKTKNAPQVESQESQATEVETPAETTTPKAPSVDKGSFSDDQHERYNRILSARRAQKPGGTE